MPDPTDNVLDEVVEIPVSDEPDNDEDTEMAVNTEYWQERLYRGTDLYDTDAKFFENGLKSAHLEGKMSAREMVFAKGGGLPTVMPLPSGMTTHIPSVQTGG